MMKRHAEATRSRKFENTSQCATEISWTLTDAVYYEFAILASQDKFLILLVMRSDMRLSLVLIPHTGIARRARGSILWLLGWIFRFATIRVQSLPAPTLVPIGRVLITAECESPPPTRFSQTQPPCFRFSSVAFIICPLDWNLQHDDESGVNDLPG